MVRKINLYDPLFTGNEWNYVKECLDTGWVSSAGKYVSMFEEKIAKYTGAKFAISTVNGTSALQVSLRIAGVLPGDEVIVPTITFIAPVNAVHYNGADPIFMDSDSTYNIDVEKTIAFIKNHTFFKDGHSYNKISRKRIIAIIPVHVYGNPVWFDEIISICKERNIKVIEDASESLGSLYLEGKYCSQHTGTIGDLGCLSFNANKVITTGGGGMILTNDENYAETARYLVTQAKDDRSRYVHNNIGYNFRLTNIPAAVGCAQMEQLENILSNKKRLHEYYFTKIEKISGLEMVLCPINRKSNYWMNLIQIDKQKFRKNLDSLIVAMSRAGIQTRPVWHLNHLQKPYLHCQSYKIENAHKIVNNSLCLPSSSHLNQEDQNTIIKILNG